LTDHMEGRRLGQCRVGPEIGSGGMGTVYLGTTVGEAYGLPPDSRVAVKIVHPHLVQRPGFLDRFLREGEVGRRIDHPNVVRTLDLAVAESNGATVNYLVMEYVEGRTLRSLLDDRDRVP
jgi:eukaryotic-like serine/threonine-protein kinase